MATRMVINRLTIRTPPFWAGRSPANAPFMRVVTTAHGRRARPARPRRRRGSSPGRAGRARRPWAVVTTRMKGAFAGDLPAQKGGIRMVNLLITILVAILAYWLLVP